MKRNISIALVVALIVTVLSVFATAASIETVEIAFTPPSVGQAYGDTNVSVTNRQDVFASVVYFLAVDSLEELKQQSKTEIDTFLRANGFATVADNKQNIIVISLYFESDTLSTIPTMWVSGGTYEGALQFDAQTIYAYVSFTPTTSGTSSATTSNNVKDVNVTYVPGVPSANIYSVDITWGSMEFTYTAASEGTWNPSTHKFDNKVASSWSCEENANMITITNHSNMSITAALSFSPVDSFSKLTSSFKDTSDNALTDSSLRIASAVGSNTDKAPSASVYLELSGDIADPFAEKTKCGTVTVTIQQN